MNPGTQLTLQDYLQIARRRWWQFLIPFVLVTGAAAALSIWMPPVFESKGTILIESQQVPDELVRSTVTSYADERIQVIQQLVMTRENLLRIIGEYDLFPESRAGLTVSEQLALIRERIDIQKVASNLGSGRSRTTIAFTVGYEDPDPGRAFAVANELLTLFLEENVRSRTARANETTQFLVRQAETLRADLERIELEIAQYKQENGDALPEHLDLHMSMLERVEDRIKANALTVRSTEDQLRILQIERSSLLQEYGLVGGDSSDSSIAATNQTLPEAEARLSKLLSIYTPRHPDVRRQSALVDRLRNAAPASDATQDEALAVSSSNPAIARIEVEIVSAADRVSSLRSQTSSLEAERERLENIIVQTPQVQRELTALTRDYENTLNKYRDIQAKEMEARVAENLEQDRKAERFTLIEPAIRPDKPIKPNRRKLMLFGLIFAAGVAGGLIMVLELADQRIRGVNSLARIVGEQPLVQLPYIETLDERKRKRRLLKRLTLVAAVGVVAGVATVHYLYMPLDLLTMRIMSRIS